MNWKQAGVYGEALRQLFFPQVCAGCGSVTPAGKGTICFSCLLRMPATFFEELPGNPVEQTFWGRLPVEAAASGYYFQRGSVLQSLMHRFKYHGDRELGLQLGRLIGARLVASGRFEADLLVPVPLHPRKQRIRGFNQAAILCQGISEVTGIQSEEHLIERPAFTETQTHRSRQDRWENMADKFRIRRKKALSGKCVLLIDDVITTGATIEACGRHLIGETGIRLQVASLCFAARV